jgi:hypothetical protein
MAPTTPAIYHSAIELGEQIVEIARHDLHDFQFQGFFRGNRGALPHGGFSPLNVSIAPARDGFHVTDGEVFQFLCHGLIRFRLVAAGQSAECNRVGSTDRCRRSHRGDVGGQGNKATGAGCSGAGRCNVDNHRNR